jgi:hypothetical protein
MYASRRIVSLFFFAAVAALALVSCGGGPASPSNSKAQLTIDFSPNPVRIGQRPIMRIRETAGVGVSATALTVRGYDANGALLSTNTVTGTDAWFPPCQTIQDGRVIAQLIPSSDHLAANVVCELLQSTATAGRVSQSEWEWSVRDDNGHDLKFASARRVDIP